MCFGGISCAQHQQAQPQIESKIGVYNPYFNHYVLKNVHSLKLMRS